MIDKGRRRTVSMLGLAGLSVATGLSTSGVAKAEPMGWPLWRLQSGPGTICLVGETPPRAKDWTDARITTLLRQSKLLWTETNQVYLRPQKELLEKYAMDGRSLSSRLDAHDSTRLGRAAALCKIDVKDLEPYRPWCAAALLQETYYGVSGNTGKSADRVLSEEAKARDIPIQSEFATKDDVMSWFGAMTPQQDVDFLRYTLDEVLNPPRANEGIYDSWARGDLKPASAEVARFSHLYPSLADVLTAKRNERWIPRFQDMLSTTGTKFVVVGLYHLVGPKGLLSIARQQGISVSGGYLTATR